MPADLNAKTPQTAQPVYSPPASSGPALPAAVTITTLTTGAVIRWSLTAAPETEADGTPCTGPVTVGTGQFLHARAFRAGYPASPLALEGYA